MIASHHQPYLRPNLKAAYTKIDTHGLHLASDILRKDNHA